jgi:hypothetical protein
MIETQRLDAIATWMKVIKITDLPAILTGIFFMDGNPLPDYCITFYNLDWDSQNRTLLLPVSGPRQWSFHRSLPGLVLLRGAQLLRFTYKIQFADDSLMQAQVIPLVLGIPIPTWLINATMSRAQNSNGDIWDRKNLWFGGIARIGEYTLRRIIDAEGANMPAFADMLNKVDEKCLIITE